jgi:hypothetical protein
MKTNLSTAARLQPGLILAAASLGLLAFALVRSSALAAGPMMPAPASTVTKSSTTPGAMPMPGMGMTGGAAAMPSMPSAPGNPMPAGGAMNTDMANNMAAMMKNMSVMMEHMSQMMAAPATGKADAMPMADMTRMREMMKTMSDMMGMIGGGLDKTSSGMGGMCACCDMMSSKMDMMKNATPTEPAKPADDNADPHAGHTNH